MDGANPLVPSTGSYSQPVSKAQAQMHCLVDADNAVRSFAVTSGASKAGFRHNAESTAIGLVFITLGIMSTDPVQAQDRISTIRSLSSFAALENYLAKHLPSRSVTTLGAAHALQSLVGTCISDYWNAQGVGSDASFSPRVTSDPSVAATRSGSSGTLSNSGWRFVAVAREDLAADGTSLGANIGVPPFTLLGGAHGFSVGDYAVHSIGEPSTFVDHNPPAPDTAQVRYWFSGPGYRSGQTPPSSIQTVLSDRAAANTVFFYIVTPFIDLFGGIATKIKLDPTFAKIVEHVLSEASTSVSLSSLMDALHSNDADAILTATSNLLTGLISLISGFIVLAVGEEAAPVAAAVAAAFSGLATGLAVLNLTVVYTHWKSYKDVSAITVNTYSLVGSWDENGVRAITFNSDGTVIEEGIGSGTYKLVGSTLTLTGPYGTTVYTIAWTDADHFSAVGTNGSFNLSRESRSAKRDAAPQRLGANSMFATSQSTSH
ncbi:MAG: hypothetical protein EON58_06555 [Alphaproteobacteria bacterium]|nr:MAG: hypothetical protein EON58_06555 [Alphaproteobacteria bacterium]